jgi:hypothetical protein
MHVQVAAVVAVEEIGVAVEQIRPSGPSPASARRIGPPWKADALAAKSGID